MSTAKAQKYRVNWLQQTGLSPAVNKALGMQLANIDEMFETLFAAVRRSDEPPLVPPVTVTETTRIGDWWALDGTDGIDGLEGPAGRPGVAGPMGPMGMPGLDGLDGLDGPDGRPGPIGVAGAAGLPGMAGQDGEDAGDAAPVGVNLESLRLTGTPTAPTAAALTNTTQLATTAYVQTAAHTPVVQTTTSTGTQNDLALTANVQLLRLNNASLLTITGFSAGVDGQVVVCVSIGAGQVDLSHQDTGSAAAGRLINLATIGKTSLAPGTGVAIVTYDGTTARWRLTFHDQGAWITPAYAAGTYTTDTGTWTVDSGDVIGFKYRLSGRTLIVSTRIDTTTVATNPSELRITVPGGFTINVTEQDAAIVFDNSTTTSDVGVAVATSGSTYVAIFKKTFTTWAAATNTTGVRFTLAFEVA